MKYFILILLFACSAPKENKVELSTTLVEQQEVKLRVIRGVFVKGGNKSPIKNQVVILKNHNNQKQAETKTDSKGAFEFKVDIDWGPYSVYLESEDYHKLFDLNSEEKDLGLISL